MRSLGNTSVACPVCGCDRAAVRIDAGVLATGDTVLRCRDCSLVYLSGIAAERERLDESRSYWHSDEHRSIYESEVVARGNEARAHAQLARIERHTDKGRILDVGCGIGQFLRVAAARGWEPYGLDVSERACAAARQEFGADRIHCGVTAPGIYPPDHFTAITLWDVIEHLTDPLDAIAMLRPSLAPGGLLVVLTPDEDGAFKRLARGVWRWSGGLVRFPLRYVYYRPHFVSFDERALDGLFARARCRVLHREREMTDLRFARQKIRHHYRPGAGRSLVLAGLRVLQAVHAERWLTNKVTVYARRDD